MKQNTVLFGVALVAALTVAGVNSQTSLAQAPAAQAARPARTGDTPAPARKLAGSQSSRLGGGRSSGAFILS